MYKADPKLIDNLVEKYRALYKEAMSIASETPLSDDQIKAIGQSVIDDLMEKTMKTVKVQKEDREDIAKYIKGLIAERCPDMQFDSPLKWTNKGWIEKQNHESNK